MKILNRLHDRLTAPIVGVSIKQVEQIEDFIYFEDARDNVYRVYMSSNNFPQIELVKRG